MLVGWEALAWWCFPSCKALKENPLHSAELHPNADVAGKAQGEVILSAHSVSASALMGSMCLGIRNMGAMVPVPAGGDPAGDPSISMLHLHLLVSRSSLILALQDLALPTQTTVFSAVE